MFKVSGEVADVQPFEQGKATELDLRVGEVPTQYSLTVDSTVGGSVTDPGEGTFTYNAGGMVDLVASPDAGYAFANWAGDVATVAAINDPATTITMDGNYSITANFAITSYTLTMAVSGSGTTEPAVGEHSYPAGTVVDINATPDADWEFDSWTGDVADISSESTTVTMDAAKTVTATFTEIGVTYYTLTMAVSGSGSVTKDPDQLTYAADTVVELTATADPDWSFSGWSGDLTGSTNPETITMDGDKTVTATFTERIGFTTTLSSRWNLLSTPIKLATDSDALDQIFDAQSLANIEASYRWDAQSWQWEVPTSYELSPLEAVYIKVAPDASVIAEFIPSEEVSEPPSRQLQPGLNLIGPAPALEAGDFPVMPLDEALISIEVAGEFWGYCMVVSPAHNQPDWAYALGSEIKDLLPYKGYWVVMDNADTLFGFSTTPIPE
ncbi:hypothetical protein ES708_13044 [subsurface metagenome]